MAVSKNEPSEPSSQPPSVAASAHDGPASAQLLKLLVELGPIAVFFLANWRADIFVGTACFMVATIVSLVASRMMFGRIPIMPLVSGAFVITFGGLTLWLHSDVFIKIKPTIVNTLFGTILLTGLAFGSSVLKYVFEYAFELEEEGWRRLTVRWAVFFFVLAGLNEIVWRNFSNEAWISFKLWGIMPLTIAFGLAQIGLIKRYAIDTSRQSSDS